MNVRAVGPLLLAWTLAADPSDSGVTRLQALALIHAVEGDVRGGRLRRAFATLYPGESAVVEFELELDRMPP